jgi:hypothetical protein
MGNNTSTPFREMYITKSLGYGRLSPVTHTFCKERGLIQALLRRLTETFWFMILAFLVVLGGGKLRFRQVPLLLDKMMKLMQG